MKKLFTIALSCMAVAIPLIVALAQVQQPEIKVRQERNAWVAKCLRDFEAIHIGMRRGEIEKLFPLDGGLQGAPSERFRHPECMYFKVDVGFSFENDAQGRAVSSTDDPVKTVSRPYLERPRMD
jgi:hypothetical protein